jgi:predicted nuclease with TOPRIM domain
MDSSIAAPEQQKCAEFTPEHATVAPSAHATLETAGLLTGTHWVESAKGRIFLDEVISRNNTVQSVVRYTHENQANVTRIDASLTDFAHKSAERINNMKKQIEHLEARCSEYDKQIEYLQGRWSENSELTEQVRQQTEHYNLLYDRIDWVIARLRTKADKSQTELPRTVHADRANKTNSLFI